MTLIICFLLLEMEKITKYLPLYIITLYFTHLLKISHTSHFQKMKYM